ncbi:MAG: hypothetical protein Q7S00_00105 [bacterium]|nr:hypothetical protein [bacterium]
MTFRPLRRAGFWVLLGTLFSTIAFAGFFNPKLKWFTLKTEHFSIHFYEGEEEVAQRAAGYFEEAYQKLGEKFGVFPWRRTEVVVADNNDAANGFASILPYNNVFIRVVPPTPDSSLGDYDNWLRELVFHEYTHVIHFSDAGYPMKILKFMFGKLIAPNGLTPSWVAEGMAVFYETEMTQTGRGRASYSDMLLRTDTLNNHFLKLDQMAGSMFDWPGYQAGYIYGIKFWQYLARTYGEEKMLEFSHRFGSSPLSFLYVINRQAKKSYGKSFYKLWEEWKEVVWQETDRVKKRVEAEGLREGEGVVTGRDTFTRPTLSANGQELFYLVSSSHHGPEVKKLDLVTGKSETVLKKAIHSSVHSDRSGKQLAYSILGYSSKEKVSFQDLFTYDREGKKPKQRTQQKRGRDPDFSTDGKSLFFVLQETGHASLAQYDLETEKITILLQGSGQTQFDTPVVSPAGGMIVLSSWQKGQRDIYLFDLRTKALSRLTDDTAHDTDPVWGEGGRSVYFSSDRDGIANIYRISLATKKVEKITNVLTGAFAPAVAADGTVYFQYYTGKGYEIRKIKGVGFSPSPLPPADISPQRESVEKKISSVTKKYSPLSPALLPHYFQPDLFFIDNSIFLSGLIGSNDPLYRHFWSGGVTYRTDAQFLGGLASYQYTRWRPTLFTGYQRYAVNYGDLYADGVAADFFEKRQQGYAGVSYGFKKQSLSLSYLYEDRSSLSSVPAGFLPQTQGRYAGLQAKYLWSSKTSYPASISVEKGHFLSANFLVTDATLGADDLLEQQLFWGDGRLFIPLPWAHHVLAFRGAGGIAWGDLLRQGSFSLGGSLGEGLLTGASTRNFSLRGLPLGTFSRNRVMVLSSEYRMPLFRVQRGLGTAPFFMNSAHFALFADYGDAWQASQKNGGVTDFFDDFFLGTGAELRGDFVIAYHLPMSGRLGYGYLLRGRNRAENLGLSDPLTGSNLKYGIVILELGTSF